jgi:hypothetical protein
MPMAISLSGSRSLITTSLTDDIANRSDAAAGWSYNGGEIIVQKLDCSLLAEVTSAFGYDLPN